MERELARRIDRLAARAHRFHRWAHHPLCGRYAAEVVPLGRRARLCRGCALAFAGAAAGLGLGLAAPPQPGAALALAGVVLACLVPACIPRGDPRRTAARPRPPKLLTRFAPTALAAGLLGQALRAASPARVAAAALGAAAVAWALLRYRRRGTDRAACTGCPAGPPGPRCPGLAPVLRRERAMSRLAGRWIAAAAPARPAAPTASPPRRSPPAPPGPPSTPRP